MKDLIEITASQIAHAIERVMSYSKKSEKTFLIFNATSMQIEDSIEDYTGDVNNTYLICSFNYDDVKEMDSHELCSFTEQTAYEFNEKMEILYFEINVGPEIYL